MSFEAFLKFTVVSSSFVAGVVIGTNSSESTIDSAKRIASQVPTFFREVSKKIAQFGSTLLGDDRRQQRDDDDLVSVFTSPSSWKGGRYYPASDFIDTIESIFENSNILNRAVIVFLGAAVFVGGTFLLSDFFDLMSEMANRGNNQNNNGNFRHRNHQEMVQRNNLVFGNAGGVAAAGENNQQQQQPLHGPRVNREFVDRMEFVGARQPPANYQPQPIREDQAATVPCCIICLTNQRDCIAEPCGHFFADWNCAMLMAEHAMEDPRRHSVECPVCRQRVEAFSFVILV
jgi:hypothetical protein